MRARRTTYALVGAGAVALVALLLVRGWLAAHDLRDAQARLPALRAAVLAGQQDRASAELAALQQLTRSARQLTSGPDWWLAARVPYLGRTPSRAAALAAAVDELSRQVAPQLLDLADVLAPQQLHSAPGRPVDLAVVQRARPTADAALDGVERVRARLPRQAGGVARPVSDAEQLLRRQLDELAAGLRTLSDVTRVLPGALGAHGPRRYLVVFQTNAEARGTGGLAGAYGVLEAELGRLRFTQVDSNRDLIRLPAARIDLGTDFRALYGNDATLFQNANLSPHFPFAAQLWSDMWAQRYGETLDGVVATDPIALAAVLRVLGPVTTPGGDRVTADDVVSVTESDAYARFPDVEARKAFLVSIARTVVDQLLSADAEDLDGLLSALRPIVAAKRLVVYSRHPDEQALLEAVRLGGTLPLTRAPYAHVVVNNAGGNKLDYYLDRAVRYTLGRCADGRRSTVVEARLTNRAPVHGLPAYVVGSDDRLLVSLYATAGAVATDVRADGEPVPVVVGRERGHPVFLVSLDVPPSQTRVLRFALDEPARPERPRAPEQPLVRPQSTSVSTSACGAG